MAKGPQAFRTISEAADELGVPQHVLRFWETRFSFIRPMKRAGGRRVYRPQDLALLAGVQALHKEQGTKALLAAVTAPATPVAPPAPEPARLEPAPARVDFDTPLFDDEAQEADLFASPAAPTPPPRPRLSADGRVKLAATLTGLEEIKARLDGLLKP